MTDWLEYDGLTREQFDGTSPLMWRQQPSRIVLHSTEGSGFPSAETYGNGTRAPHFTTNLRTKECRQHYPLTKAARALIAAGVSTNTLGAIQIEIIGTASDASSIEPKMSRLTDGELSYLAGLLRAISAATDIPLVSTVTWVRYPDSYGVSASQRLTAAEWYAYRGVLGHQHVPGNSHGDPGAINVARLLTLANPTTKKPTAKAVTTSEEDDYMRLNLIRRTSDGALALTGPGIFINLSAYPNGLQTATRLWHYAIGNPKDATGNYVPDNVLPVEWDRAGALSRHNEG